MPATLTVTVPDDTLAELQREAADTGSTPEQVAAARLAAPRKPGGFRRLAGTLLSDVTDASVRTDDYLTGGKPGGV